ARFRTRIGGRVVVAVGVVGGRPVVLPRWRRHRQQIAWRRVRAVAVGDVYGLWCSHHVVTGVVQREGDRAGREVAAFQVGGVRELGTAAERHGGAGRGDQRRAGRADLGDLVGGAGHGVVGAVVVAVAGVADVPGVGAHHGARGGQRVALDLGAVGGVER